MIAKIKVPFVNLGLQYLELRDEIIAAIDRISSKGEYILGKDVERFESAFARYCGVEYAVAVNSGGDALYLALHVLGVGSGDEVITAPNSFIASAWAIHNVGARPVFVDVRDDYNIDPHLIEKAITPRTKAIMPVHLTGRPAAMREISDIAKRHGLHVVEDAAQAVGAKYFGNLAGSLGDIGCFSLHPLKNLHVQGDGGVLTLNNAKLVERLRKLRNHGLKNRDEVEMWGFNTRLDTIQAAIALIKLPHLDRWNSRFRQIASIYQTELKGLVNVPMDAEGEVGIYHRFVITTDNRDELQAYLLQLGIETKVNYPIPLHMQECAKELGYSRGSFPVAEKLAGKILSLPVYAQMPDEHVGMVIEGIKSFFRGPK